MDAETEGRFNQIQGQILELNQQVGRVLGHMERDAERRQGEDRAFGKFRDDIQDLFAMAPEVKSAKDLATANVAAIREISASCTAAIDKLSTSCATKFEDIEKWRNRLKGASMAYSSMFSVIGGVVVLIGEAAFHALASGIGGPHR